MEWFYPMVFWGMTLVAAFMTGVYWEQRGLRKRVKEADEAYRRRI